MGLGKKIEKKRPVTRENAVRGKAEGKFKKKRKMKKNILIRNGWSLGKKPAVCTS